MKKFTLVLLKTVPRSGATGFASTFAINLASVLTDKIPTNVHDIDYLESANCSIDQMIDEASKCTNVLMLKTHQRICDLRKKYAWIDLNNVIIINVFRCPFDVAVSTYFYLLRCYPELQRENYDIYNYLVDWAKEGGLDQIFQGKYPSYNEYANTIISGEFCTSGKSLCFSYNDVTYNRLQSCIDVLNSIDGMGSNIKSFRLNFKDFDIENARSGFGQNFILTGNGNYINNQKILQNITELQRNILKDIYLSKFSRALTAVNKNFGIELNCF